MTTDFPQRFSQALVSEIKAEMGRQDLSSRALGRRISASSQYVSARLDGGNPRTGERVTLTVKDLSAIAHALGLTEVELVERAQHAVGALNVTPLRPKNVGTPAFNDERAVARTREPEPTDEQ